MELLMKAVWDLCHILLMKEEREYSVTPRLLWLSVWDNF